MSLIVAEAVWVQKQGPSFANIYHQLPQWQLMPISLVVSQNLTRIPAFSVESPPASLRVFQFTMPP